jgi:uncharacterized NAD(P)/FAD-binding protein YdhS
MVSKPAELLLGIVGLGPRGLVVLERMLSLARNYPERAIRLDIFEPGTPGAGVHFPDQGDYLMLNTIAGQISVFPDFALPDHPVERQGPTFYEWCVSRDIRVNESGSLYQKTGRAVSELDYLPRRLLGEYLVWSFEHLRSLTPENVTLCVHRERVEDLSFDENNQAITLVGNSGLRRTVKHVFITVGHTGRRKNGGVQPGTEIFSTGHPDTQKLLRSIVPRETVGVAGLGLTSADLVAALTIGRGGIFTRGEHRNLAYLRSGLEPRILLFSRSGLPFYSRPDTTPERLRHQAIFLTATKIGEIKGRKLPLDFDDSILPILKNEMRAAYYMLAADLESQGKGEEVRLSLQAARNDEFVEQIFQALAVKYGDFSPDKLLLQKLPDGLHGSSYQNWFTQYIGEDIVESRKGLAGSPTKAAIEIWRDLRDAIRNVVDNCALHPASHAIFFGRHSAMINRLVGGPQKERHEELIALINEGIVEVFPGTSPTITPGQLAGSYILSSQSNPSGAGVERRFVSHILNARIGSSGLSNSDSPLLARLYESGVAKAVYSSIGLDGIRTDADGHPVGDWPARARHIWIFGPVVEGASYYNHYVPSPGMPSRAVSDAHRALVACLEGVFATQL